jgi:hypothetical protein
MSGGGCWNGQLEDLVRPERVSRSNAGSRGADVQGLSELDKG